MCASTSVVFSLSILMLILHSARDSYLHVPRGSIYTEHNHTPNAHKRLVLQVYLSLNTLDFSAT